MPIVYHLPDVACVNYRVLMFWISFAGRLKWPVLVDQSLLRRPSPIRLAKVFERSSPCVVYEQKNDCVLQ